MDLRQLKKWINELPEKELSDYNIVYRTIMELDDDNWNAYDIPIVSSGLDVGNKELYLCNNQSSQILDKG